MHARKQADEYTQRVVHKMRCKKLSVTRQVAGEGTAILPGKRKLASKVQDMRLQKNCF